MTTVTVVQQPATDPSLPSGDGSIAVRSEPAHRPYRPIPQSLLQHDEQHIFGLVTPHYGRLRFAPVYDQQEFLELTWNGGLPPLWCCWHQGTTYHWPQPLDALPVVTVGIWQQLNSGIAPEVWDEAMRAPQDPRPLLQSYERYYWSSKSLRVTPCTIKEANQYVRQFHRHSRPVTCALFAVQVTDAEGIVRGVALVGRPVARLLDVGSDGSMKRRIAEVVRVATDGTWNVSSLLYGAVRRIAREMGYERLITYTLQSESGHSLRTSGWTCVAETGGQQWNTAKRARAVNALYDEKKYRWECELNPTFPFERISMPHGLDEAMPFACHRFLPGQDESPATEALQEWDVRLAALAAKVDALSQFENGDVVYAHEHP